MNQPIHTPLAPEGADDLRALAWVQDELRRSLEAAHKALRRHQKEAAAVDGSDVDVVDPAVLRGARTQLHQAAGALSLVGVAPAAQLLRASESAVLRMASRPALVTGANLNTLEQASFAVLDYVARLVANKAVSGVSLFPQYRDVQKLAGADRVHPADLWDSEWRWRNIPAEPGVEPRPIDAAAREAMERMMLRIMRTPDRTTMRRMSDLCASLAAGSGSETRLATLWRLAAALFEAQASSLLRGDVFVKRAAPRLLAQVRAGAHPADVSERLAQDLLFFCARAEAPSAAHPSPRLAAAREAYGLAAKPSLPDYEAAHLGRFDPAAIALARKRVSAARDAWSAVAGGELQRIGVLPDAFALVGESIERLYPQGSVLANALNGAATYTAQRAESPRTPLAMEVATSVLYLDASLEDAELDHPQLSERVLRMAQRIDAVRLGAEPQPLDPWMEDLYRRVSDRQTMGSVVQELRTSLSDVEKQIDQYFREPARRELLYPVPAQLSKMRGVLSVLGLDQATQAVLRMRDDIDALAHATADARAPAADGVFDKLADSLGALSFLIDMLGVQPQLAKSLFSYDAQTGQLRALMGQAARKPAFTDSSFAAGPDLSQRAKQLARDAARTDVSDTTLSHQLRSLAQQALLADERVLAETMTSAQAALVQTSDPAQRAAVRSDLAQAMHKLGVAEAAPETPAPAPLPAPGDDSEMREIFLEEAREVMQEARAAMGRLNEAQRDVQDDLEEMTALRRAFHTLKGSSRMVGLGAFGDAAWACEQLYNTRLAQAPTMDEPLCTLTGQALDYLGSWIESIATGRDGGHRPVAVATAADALRVAGRLEKIGAPGAPGAAEPPARAAPARAAVPTPPIVSAPVIPLAAAAPQQSAATYVANPPAVTPPSAEPITASVAGAPPATPSRAADSSESSDLGDLPMPDWDAEMPDQGMAATIILPRGPAVPPASEPAPSVDRISLDLGSSDRSTPAPPSKASAEPVQLFASPPPLLQARNDEQIKIVGPLRIDLTMFNIYLNEADELSRRLHTEIAEWATVAAGTPGETAVSLAHSLAGSSATVGFTDLSMLSRALEQALTRSNEARRLSSAEPALYSDATAEIRRLLHQFAAGFLKPVVPGLVERLERHMPAPEPPPPGPGPGPGDNPRTQAAPAQTLSAGGLDDDVTIDALDSADEDLFPIFADEAQELLPQLQSRLRDWVSRPHDGGAPAACMRTLHTFKGGARLAGAMRLGEMAHRLETAIEHLVARGDLQAADVEPLLGRVDTIEADFLELRASVHAGAQAESASAPRAHEPAAALPPAQVLVASPGALQSDPIRESSHGLSAESSAAADSLPAALDSAAMPLPAGDDDTSAIDWHRFTVVSPGGAAAKERPAAVAAAPVRVRAPLLDRLVNQAGEVSIARSRIETDVGQLKSGLSDLTDNLERMRHQLRDIEVQAESQISSRMEAAKAASQAFDPLEMDRFTRFQELTRMMAESVNDVATVHRGMQRSVQSTEDELAAQARLTRSLQDDLLRTRMVEFEALADRLYRVVRQAAKETGKQVRLDIVGGTTEIDRGVLDRMTGPFEHLLRNSAAHGIEQPEVRTAAGKDATGAIQIQVHQEGNEVALTFSDDGAGLDLPRVRERAIALGLLDASAQLAAAELADFIFAPGFSTARVVTELSGRGVGMDVVRSEVVSMGGRIETTTTPGQGTSFKLLLPLTTAVTQVVLMRHGNEVVAVPSTLVELVRRAKPEEVEQAHADSQWTLDGAKMPFYWLGALLGGSPRGSTPGRTVPVAVIRSAAQRVALHVDEVLGNQEVVVKNLGPQLARLPGLAGMTLLPSGAVAPIYNPVALAVLYGEAARARTAAAPMVSETAEPARGDGARAPTVSAAPPAVAQDPLVLVVDDSLTVRRVTQRLLLREGYRVTTAKDGLEALERLAEEKPAVLLSDIEMPRMDGFDLVRNVRADARLADLPVIMITSRIAQKHRDYAAELGVDHYLGKPYGEEELLSLVGQHVQRMKLRAAA
jgi:chemosensory pili system protein ChpA (sensor histidine kinase/response regulator)